MLAVPALYLVMAAFFPAAREVYFSVHLLRGVILTIAAFMQMKLAREMVRARVMKLY